MFRCPLLTVQTNRVSTMFAFIIFEPDILKNYLSETNDTILLNCNFFLNFTK